MNSEGFKETEIGLIPEEWKYISIGDSPVEIIDGDRSSNYPKRGELLTNGHLPFLNTKNIKNNKFEFTDTLFVTKEKFDSIKKGKLKENDIVMTTRGSVGNIALFKNLQFKSAIINAQMLIFRADEKKVSSQYLYYLLISDLLQKQFITFSSGSAQPQLPISHLKSINLIIPSIQEQKAIAKILSNFDLKIELNNQINKTLEKIGQTIFRHWFVHFEFPDINNRPYKFSGGQMIDSDLGDIPINWLVKNLPEVAKIVDCLHTKKPEMIESDNILLQVYNISNDGTLNLDKTYTVSESDYSEWTKNILLKEGDCLITNAGRVGAVGQVPSEFIGGIGRNITAIRPIKVSPTYLFSYLFSKHGLYQIKLLTDQGTILNSLNVKGIKKIKILIPNKDTLTSFDNFARQLREMVEKNNSENIFLSKIRDSLLPKLISGKIRIMGD